MRAPGRIPPPQLLGPEPFCFHGLCLGCQSLGKDPFCKARVT